MRQEELEALLAQIAPNNDPRRLEFAESTETVEMPDPSAPEPLPGQTRPMRKTPVRTMTWVDRGTGQTLKVQVDPTTGTYTKTFQGIDPKQQGEPATTPAQQAAAAGGEKREAVVVGGKNLTKVTTAQDTPDGRREETYYEDPATGQRVQPPTEEPQKPTIAPAQAGRPAVQYVPDADKPGQVKAVPIPGAPAAPEASAEQLSAPSDQMWIAVQTPGQPPKFVKNPNYIKPSKIMPDPGDPTKLVNITHDDNGNVISVPVTGTTVIKPADLPVLQANYGQIAQGLGALAQDLNSRYARGEITEQQKNTAFTAAHQQAQTQVAEINSILETSKSIWSGELTQRGHSLNETQSRRGFAQNIFDRAAATGMGIATSAGPGHGKAIAGGVQALMNMGQRYAEGMGGFRESPEVALPPALQQARGIGLPGFGAPGAAPGPPGAPTSPPGPPGPPAPPGEAGGPGAAPPPPAGPPGAGGLPAPLLRPPPPVTGSVAAPGAPGSAGLGDPGFYRGPGGGGEAQDPGFYRGPPGGGEAIDPGFFRPGMQGMGGALQSGLGFGGSPVAAGGGGVYDPTPDVQSMIGDGADPTWAEAVRAAAAEVTQPGYAWQRFQQPASRFG